MPSVTTPQRGAPPANAEQGLHDPAPGGSPTDGNGADKATAESLAKLEKQMAGQSAIIRRLQEKIEREAEIPVEEPDPELAPAKKLKGEHLNPYLQQLKELQEKQKTFEEERTRSHKVTAMQNIYANLVAKGFDAKAAGLVTEALYNRLGTKVVTVDGQFGVPALAIKDGEAEPIALTAWLDAFAQSDEGKALTPPKPAPSLSGIPRGSGPPQGGIMRVTKADLASGRVSTADVAAGKVFVIDAE